MDRVSVADALKRICEIIAYRTYTVKMQQYTAEYLNSLPALKQAEAVAAFVNRVAGRILDAATKGYTAYVYEEKHFASFSNSGLGPQLLRRPSLEELAVAFQAQFPDCKIEIQDNWVDVRPGVREQRSQIVIDWTPTGKPQNLVTWTQLSQARNVL